MQPEVQIKPIRLPKSHSSSFQLRSWPRLALLAKNRKMVRWARSKRIVQAKRKRGMRETLIRGLSRLLRIKMVNDLANNLQINLFECPERLINLAFPVKFDEYFSLPRPRRRIREKLE